MTTIARAIMTTLGAGILSAIFVSNAVAGCGDVSELKGQFEFARSNTLLSALAPAAHAETAPDHFGSGGSRASIVGLWKVQLISKGNTSHNPPIPDGALIDF